MEEIRRQGNRFYMGESSKEPLAEITFVEKGFDHYIIERTFVSDSLRGQGAGQRLVNRVVELARKENKKIIPQCPYAKKVMTGSPEYADVLL